jgi:molybdopterin-guanine dinucleotide biosynthesis protein A
MPTLVPAVLTRLIAALDPSSDLAILATSSGPVPLPMAVRPANVTPAVRRLVDSGERRLRALPDTVATHVIPEATWRVDDPDGRTLRDVDTPSDLDR